MRSATRCPTIWATGPRSRSWSCSTSSPSEGLRKAVVLAAERPGETILPAELRLANGTSAYRAPGGTRYATGDHLKAERQLARAGYARGAALMQPHLAEAFCGQLATAGLELGADQEAAVRGILTSGAKVETLIGPAGTGKSRVDRRLGQGVGGPRAVVRQAAPHDRAGGVPGRDRGAGRRRRHRPQHHPVADDAAAHRRRFGQPRGTGLAAARRRSGGRGRVRDGRDERSGRHQPAVR